MQSNNNDNPGRNGRNNENSNSQVSGNGNSQRMNDRENKSQHMAGRNEDQDRYIDDRGYGWNTSSKADKYRDIDSKTFNEDEESWDNKNRVDENRETNNNDWDANDPLERGSESYRYDDEQRNVPSYENASDEEQRDAAGDYINSDHSDYNRNNNRFRWETPGEDE